MNKFGPALKAIVGGLVAGLTTLATALTDNHVSGQEGVYVVLAFLAGTGIVYAVPNKTTTPTTGDAAK